MFSIPNIFNLPPPQPNMFGKTRYRYITPDGGPPMDGKVPSGSPFDPPNPFSQAGNCIPGAMHPFGLPNPLAAPSCPFTAASQSWFCTPTPTPPPSYCSSPPVSTPPKPAMYTWTPPPPPPPPPASHSFGGTYGEREEPLDGNRVKGQLATFPDKSTGYIFPKRNVTLHLFAQNVVNMYPPVANVVTIRNDRFNVQHAPCDMTFEELIEQINCRKRANHHPPYNQPGNGYPEHLIGIQELIELGTGQFMLGSKIMLTEPQAKSRIGDVWSETTGNAGQNKPRYVVRLPV